MKRILVFAGSNNPTSINRQLALYAKSQLEQRIFTSIIDLRDFPMPVYNIETELNQGIPSKAKELKQLLTQYDGYVITIAEHNGSVTAFLKSTLDWLSRVDKSYGVFQGKPIILLGTSPGQGGAGSALQHAEAIIKRIAGKVIGKVSLPRFFENVRSEADSFEIVDNNKKDEIINTLNRLVLEVTDPIHAI
jgi:chromate reductase